MQREQVGCVTPKVHQRGCRADFLAGGCLQVTDTERGACPVYPVKTMDWDRWSLHKRTSYFQENPTLLPAWAPGPMDMRQQPSTLATSASEPDLKQSGSRPELKQSDSRADLGQSSSRCDSTNSTLHDQSSGRYVDV